MPQTVRQHFIDCRNKTESICKPLETEDYSIQPIVDVSPPKWHLAHTTWFFEEFVLSPHLKNYKVFHEDYAFLFNSYYNNVGERVIRSNRGLLTRPTVVDVYSYRKYVTDQLVKFLESKPDKNIQDIIKLGINHEEQHQELLAYDIKYILGYQPTFPKYTTEIQLKEENWEHQWIKIDEGISEIGYEGNDFHYDNERNRHKTYIQSFEISNKLVTNREYLDFMEDGGYENFNLWHAPAWDFINKEKIKAPLHWHKKENQWKLYHYAGLVDINPHLPVMHVSMYEAYAFAEWKGMRLPTEAEWEVASEHFKWGQLWEWTNSAYLPYPGFKTKEGALGEYNGKFMINQMVMRGASIATAKGHSRKTYRNFFHPNNRWHFSGIRLAK